ncbi:hypothetical protein WBJ53_05380 [Spirosoma sp. SC4-14]|uniref:hypothetical protein n=1 Tax=Spirosoma sp. SC4-14 TaxID=3128900 RepID=UPI0030CF70A9
MLAFEQDFSHKTILPLPVNLIAWTAASNYLGTMVKEQVDRIRVGAAWEHGDKDGLNLSLNILGQKIPVVVRKNKPKAN